MMAKNLKYWLKGLAVAAASMIIYAVALGCYIALMLLIISMEEGGDNLSAFSVPLTEAVVLLSQGSGFKTGSITLTIMPLLLTVMLIALISSLAKRIGTRDVYKRQAIYKAKKASMPADNIKRAVKRGSGEEAGGANYEDIVYEGYAPAGVGLIIECLTDNRNRAAAEVRSTLTKGNGSLATSGSVSFNFERKGQIIVPAEGVDFDDLFEKAAEAGAEDVTEDGDVFTVVTDPSEMIDVRKALQDAGFDYDSADLVMMPKNEVELTLEDAQKVSKLIDNLDDLDDVQNIYSNWTASDEVMAQLDEE